MCLQSSFLLSNEVFKNGKSLPAMVPMQTNMIYSVQVFLLGFYIYQQDHAEFKGFLNY